MRGILTGLPTTAARLTDEDRARCAERARAIEEADARAILEAAFTHRVKRSGIPRRYRRPHWHGEAAKALDAFNAGTWCLYVHGDVGRGKTDYAASVMVEAIGRRPFGDYRFVDEATLVDGLAEREADEDGLARCRLLVVDDMGKARPQPWVLARVWKLLNARYSDGLPTVLTSQLDRGGLVAHMARIDEGTAKSLASRLRDGVLDVPLGGPDRRLDG